MESGYKKKIKKEPEARQDDIVCTKTDWMGNVPARYSTVNFTAGIMVIAHGVRASRYYLVLLETLRTINTNISWLTVNYL